MIRLICCRYCHNGAGPSHESWDCPLVPGKDLEWFRKVAIGLKVRRDDLFVKKQWLAGIEQQPLVSGENERRRARAREAIGSLRAEIVQLMLGLKNGPPGWPVYTPLVGRDEEEPAWLLDSIEHWRVA